MDPNDGPPNWEEWDQERWNPPWTRETPKKSVKVRFLKDCTLDMTLKDCSVVSTELCDQTSMPILFIKAPWGEEQLRCEWYDGEWVCDLDRTSYQAGGCSLFE